MSLFRADGHVVLPVASSHFLSGGALGRRRCCGGGRARWFRDGRLMLLLHLGFQFQGRVVALFEEDGEHGEGPEPAEDHGRRAAAEPPRGGRALPPAGGDHDGADEHVAEQEQRRAGAHPCRQRPPRQVLLHRHEHAVQPPLAVAPRHKLGLR